MASDLQQTPFVKQLAASGMYIVTFRPSTFSVLSDSKDFVLVENLFLDFYDGVW